MGDDVAWDLVDKLAPCMLMLSAGAIGTSKVILRYCVPNFEIMLKFLKHADVKWKIEGKFLAVRNCSCSVLLVIFSFFEASTIHAECAGTHIVCKPWGSDTGISMATMETAVDPPQKYAYAYNSINSVYNL